MGESNFSYVSQYLKSLYASCRVVRIARAAVLLAILFAGIAASQPIVEEIPDEPKPGVRDNRDLVVVVVQPVQRALYAPTVFTDRYKPERPILEGWADPSVWELIALQPGYRIPVRKPAEIGPGVSAFASLITDFDFFAATSSMLEAVDSGADWYARSMHEFDFVDDKGKWHPRRIGRRGLVHQDGASFVLIRLWYSMTPDLRRVRLIVQLRMYEREDVRGWATYPEQFRRTYEYLSPPLTPALRPWAPGQQERLIQALDETYKARLKAYPVNKTTYHREYKRGVRVLERRSNQLMPDFLLEGWPQDKLAAALTTAAQAVGRMMQYDLRSMPPAYYRNGDKQWFFALSAAGKREKYWGSFLFHDGDNSVFQRGGGYYSVPTED